MGVIHLIRHGRPTAMEETAPSLLKVDRVLASPLIRAFRTAELLYPRMRISVVPELAERGMGEWERKRWDEVEAGWPELAARASLDWFGTTPPGGEAWPDFAARVERGWLRVPRDGTTAIVAHAGVNSVLAHLAAGRELVSFQQDYLEVISLAISD